MRRRVSVWIIGYYLGACAVWIAGRIDWNNPHYSLASKWEVELPSVVILFLEFAVVAGGITSGCLFAWWNFRRWRWRRRWRRRRRGFRVIVPQDPAG